MAGLMQVQVHPPPPTLGAAVWQAIPESADSVPSMCANRAGDRTSPAARQKSADLTIVWLMLAVQFEGQGCPHPAGKGKGNPKAASVYRKEPQQ